jgi:hypothetical protein
MVEMLLFLLDVDEKPDTWPGSRSMGTKFLGRIPLDGGGGATLVYSDSLEMPKIPSAQNGSPHCFAGKSRDDLATANRMVAWGQSADGSIWFMESPLESHISRVG